MTILLIALGGIAAACGTRLAALLFIGAAVSSALGTDAAVTTWSAALCAGWVLLTSASPRWIALPALGAAAAAAAGMSENAAVVGGLWVLGTAAAGLAAASTEDGRRWGLALAGLDVVVIAAVAVAAIEAFEGWPRTMGGPLAAILLASAALRALLVGGVADQVLPGLIVVRAQVAVLVVAAVVGGGPWVARAAIALGASGFAIGPYLRRPVMVDAIQELGLYATAVAATQLGWTTRGWAWGALAAGTLIHHLRLMVGRGYAGQWAELALRAGGLGLPFLPVAGAVLEGALGPRGWEAAVLATGLMVGFAGRLRAPVPRPRRRSKDVLDHVRGGVVVAAAAIASLSASALSLPRPPGGSAIGWPGTVAVAVVVSAAIAGTRFKVVASRSAPPNPTLEALVDWQPPVALVPSRPLVLWVALGSLGLCSVALWIVGLTRGFL